MLPYQKIVCPTDFSDPSYEAVKAACEIALRDESTIFLAHVTRPATPAMTMADPLLIPATAPPHIERELHNDQIAENGLNSLENLIAKVVPKNVEAKPVVLFGNVAEEITELAAKEDADLITIATHGSRGWSRVLFGSVTEKVIRSANCPVLTVTNPSGWHN